MKIKALFTEIEPVEPPPKLRKSCRRYNRFTPKENRRRYRLHRKVKDLGVIELKVRAREMVVPFGFDCEKHPFVMELIQRFKYYAPIIISDYEENRC